MRTASFTIPESVNLAALAVQAPIRLGRKILKLAQNRPVTFTAGEASDLRLLIDMA